MKAKLPDLSPLTSVQIRTLCAFAGLAFKRLRDKGGMDDTDTVETFRHREQLAAVGVGSLKAMNQGHYRDLKAHWLMLLGLVGEAFDLLMKTGDGQEQRELMQWQISGCAANLALAFQHKGQKLDSAVDGAWSYILKIARDKFQGRKLSELDTLEMVDLRNTIINRTNAKMGRGRPESRNKSQRQKRPTAPALADQADDLQPFARRDAPVSTAPTEPARIY